LEWDEYLVDRLEGCLEGTLPEPWPVKLASPNQVRVAEHDLHRLGCLVVRRRMRKIRRADYATRSNYVKHSLDVQRPVAWVVEDKYRTELNLREVGLLDRTTFNLCEIVEGPNTAGLHSGF
jgi:hypothetical protein